MRLRTAYVVPSGRRIHLSTAYVVPSGRRTQLSTAWVVGRGGHDRSLSAGACGDGPGRGGRARAARRAARDERLRHPRRLGTASETAARPSRAGGAKAALPARAIETVPAPARGWALRS